MLDKERWQRPIVGVLLATAITAAVMFLETWHVAILFALIGGLVLWEWVRLLTGSVLTVVLQLAAFIGLLAWGWWGRSSIDDMPGRLFLLFALGWWVFMFVLITVYREDFRRHKIWSYLFLSAAPLVVAVAWFSLVYLHNLKPLWLLYLFALVVTADTSAYYAGRAWGRSKLAPTVSPGKTVAGLWGALGGALLVSAAVAGVAQDTWLLRTEWMLVSLLAALVCVVGDLAESLIKRYAGKKDSGSCLPGHGGLFDRADGLLAAAPLFLIALLY